MIRNGAGGIGRSDRGPEQFYEKVALHERHNAGNVDRRLVAPGQ
jgi:hypothetical protein